MRIMRFPARIAVAAGMAVGAAVLFVVNPAGTSWLPGCPLHAMTGMRCPFCGTTRALHELMHGHITAAFALNPLTMSLVPVALYFAVRGRWPAWQPVAWWTWLGLVAAFSVWRNIPGG